MTIDASEVHPSNAKSPNRVTPSGILMVCPTELYEECVNTYYVYDNGVYVTSINERRIAFEYQDVFAYNYTFPSNASLMEFLED